MDAMLHRIASAAPQPSEPDLKRRKQAETQSCYRDDWQPATAAAAEAGAGAGAPKLAVTPVASVGSWAPGPAPIRHEAALWVGVA